MADGGGHIGAPMADLILARARAHRGPFTCADILASLSWLKRGSVSTALSEMARARKIALIDRVPARRGRGANLYSLSVSDPMPLIADAAGVARRPDIDAADKAWSARFSVGARFNDPPTPIEIDQLREIAWHGN